MGLRQSRSNGALARYTTRVARLLSNVIGIDDAPFSRPLRARVPVVGAVFSRTRLDGVLIDRVRRDGADSTARIVGMLRSSPFIIFVSKARSRSARDTNQSSSKPSNAGGLKGDSAMEKRTVYHWRPGSVFMRSA